MEGGSCLALLLPLLPSRFLALCDCVVQIVFESTSARSPSKCRCLTASSLCRCLPQESTPSACFPALTLFSSARQLYCAPQHLWRSRVIRTRLHALHNLIEVAPHRSKTQPLCALSRSAPCCSPLLTTHATWGTAFLILRDSRGASLFFNVSTVGLYARIN